MYTQQQCNKQICKKTQNTYERCTLSILTAEIEHPISLYFQNILIFLRLKKLIELIN